MQFNEARARYLAEQEAKNKRATRFFLSQHFDANETAFLERELTFKRSLVQEVMFQDLQARTFLPIANDIPPNAETYSWKVLTQTGKARVGARGNKDIPRVDVSGDERTGKTVKIDAAYGWEIEELAEAARIGFPLLDAKVKAAQRAIALGIDDVLATGKPGGETGLPFTGFVNNADVEGLGILNPTGDPWTNATTPANILQSLNDMVSEVITDVGNIQQLYPDTILLPTAQFLVASQVHVDATNDVSVLRSFLNNNPFIKNIAPWQKLTGAGAGGATDRAIIYKRDPLVLEGVVCLDFMSLPPQAQGFEMVVPCMGRAGGVKVYHPAAMRYADFAP